MHFAVYNCASGGNGEGVESSDLNEHEPCSFRYLNT